jgi:3-oxoacyl-[acyl-carrier protein] reductase
MRYCNRESVFDQPNFPSMRSSRLTAQLPIVLNGTKTMQPGLRGKVALIPAGSGGLGRAAALELAAGQARVAICGRDAARLEQAAGELRARGASDALALRGDCTRAEDMTAIVHETEARFGRIDILVANSPGPLARPFETLTDDDWRTVLDVKVVSQVRQARLVWPGMARRGWGRIIFLAGTHGRQPHAYALTAGVANAALLSLAKGLAEAGGPHGILVNAVNPGPMNTDRMRYLVERKASEDAISPAEVRSILERETLLGRFGEASEVGAAIAFLASERASFITGVYLDVDGGQTKAF